MTTAITVVRTLAASPSAAAARLARHLFVPALVFALVALAPAAFAQTLTVDGPATFNPDNAAVMDVTIGYSLPPGTHPSVVIELPWPEPVPGTGSVAPVFVTSAYASTFAFSTAVVSGTTYYRWTATNLVVEGTSTSGGINVSAKLLRFGARNGTAYTWAPTMRGSLVATATPDTTLAVPEAKLKYHDVRVSSTNWIQGNNGLGVGLLVRYDFRFENYGNARIIGGATIDVTLGRNTYFVAAFAADDNEGVPPPVVSGSLTFTSVPTAWTRPDVGEPDQVVSAIAVDQVGDSVGQLVGDFYDTSPHLHVDVFIPCEYVGPDLTISDPLFSATVVSVGQEALADGTTVARTAGQTPGLTSPGVVFAPLAATGYACGEGGGLTKHEWYDEIRGTDTNIEWKIVVDPPKAVIPFERAMVVDRLPEGLSNVTTTLSPQHTATPGDRPGFVSYYCTFDAAALASLSVDTFLALAATRCTNAFDAARNYLVLWAPEGWGSDTFGIEPADFRVFTYVPADWLQAHTSPMVNFAWFEGRADDDDYGGPGPVAVRQWYDEGRRIISAASLPFVEDYTSAVDFDPITPDRQTPPRTVARGQASAAAFRIYVNPQRAPALNPKLEVTPPPGVVVTRVRTVYQTSIYPQCDPGMDLVTTPPQGLTAPLTWQFGEDDTPYRLRFYCAYGIVDFVLPTTYPFVNGQSLSFHGVVSADNQERPHATDVTFTASVPPEMRVNVDGSCWDDGEPGRPGFRVTSLNTGGVNLTGIVTTFDVPANATYAGLDPATDNVPLGASFEISANGTDWTTTAPGDAADVAIRHVRLREFGIVAGVDARPVRFKVRVVALDGNALQGAAWMDAAELAPTPLTTTTFVPGTCPSDIVMRKFFDADGDGDKALDEPALAGWTFTLGGGQAYSQVTAGPEGEVRFLDVPPGTYAFAETPPVGLGAQSTWSQTTGITSIVVSGDGAALSFDVGNRCACVADFDGNECTAPGCDATGACTSPEAPAAEGETCGADECHIRECQAGACVPVSDVDCADDDLCTNDTCDEVEGCSNDRPACGVVDFYANVSDGARTGRVHCTVTAGAAPLCETEGDGRTLAIVWDAPDMCGAWTDGGPEK